MKTIVLPSGFTWQELPYQGDRMRWELWSPNGRLAAGVWHNFLAHIGEYFTWHTWDERGIGGQNSTEPTLREAQTACESALFQQGWHVTAKRKRPRKRTA